MFRDEVQFTIPRNEYELCKIFEDLVFMKTEKFFSSSRSEPKLNFTDKGLELLGTLGITGRIFRRWYQTNWGYNNPSRHFQGETPRQELSIRYPDLEKGLAYLTVELVRRESGQLGIVPHFFDKKSKEISKGLFTAGEDYETKNKTRYKLSFPSYDPGFKEALSLIKTVDKEISGSIGFPEDQESKYLNLFWEDVFLAIALNSEIDLPRDSLVEIASNIRIIFEKLIREQGTNRDNFISFDEAHYFIWQVLCHFDHKLLSQDILLGSHDVKEILSYKNGEYSLTVHYTLTNNLDELLFFPADRYFGAVECVWTDKMHFMQDMFATTELLNNNLIMKTFDKRSKRESRFESKMIEKASDPYSIWYAPCTAFRILPSALERLRF